MGPTRAVNKYGKNSQQTTNTKKNILQTQITKNSALEINEYRKNILQNTNTNNQPEEEKKCEKFPKITSKSTDTVF